MDFPAHAPAATAFKLTRGVLAGILVSMALAVAIAWISLAIAYRTDWPTSFWITALGAAAYLASGYALRSSHVSVKAATQSPQSSHLSDK